MVFGPGHEEHIPGLEFCTAAYSDEISAAGHHHIDLIARVRLLRISLARSIQLDAQCSMLEQLGEAFALASGKFCKTLSNSDFVDLRRRHGYWTRRAAGSSPALPWRVRVLVPGCC